MKNKNPCLRRPPRLEKKKQGKSGNLQKIILNNAKDRKAAMDRLDRMILSILQEDVTLPVAEIGRRVGLSTTPCWRRIQKMEEDGVIKGPRKALCTLAWPF